MPAENFGGHFNVQFLHFFYIFQHLCTFFIDEGPGDTLY